MAGLKSGRIEIWQDVYWIINGDYKINVLLAELHFVSHKVNGLFINSLATSPLFCLNVL